MRKQARANPHHPVLHHVLKEASLVSEAVGRAFRLDPPEVAALFELGAIYSKGKRVLEDVSLDKGAHLTVHVKPRRYPVERIDWRQTLVHAEADFVVVNKPAGIPVHATVDNQVDNVLHQLRRVTGHHLLVTQRLDLPVGGLMVFGKTPAFQRDFNRWLEERRVHKRYRALAEKAVPPGRQVHYMEPAEKDPRRMSREPRPDWLRCELTIHAVHPSTLEGREVFDVEVELHTGRMHQIRAQLGALGSPLVGDRLYGARSPYHPKPGLRAIGLFSALVGWEGREFRAQPPWV